MKPAWFVTSEVVCYTCGRDAQQCKLLTSSRLGGVAVAGRRGGAVDSTWTPEAFWRVFEVTGSIWAYLIYRQLTGRKRGWVVPILN